MGYFYLRQGALSQAIRVFERGLGLREAVNFQIVFRHCIAGLGVAYALFGRVTDALPLLQQVLEQAQFSGPRGLEPLYPIWLGEAYVLVGRWTEALPLGQQALELTRTWKQSGNQAYALRLLGEIAARREPAESEQAAVHYREALALADALGMRPLQAHCHRDLGTLYATTGQRKQARTALSTAIEMYKSMDMTFWLPQTEAVLAQVEGQ
jgi:tetratricopeptide (TPR) repeat protein